MGANVAKENEFQIRPDLADIKDALYHIHQHENYYYEIYDYLSKIWEELIEQDLLKIKNKEFVEKIEEIYEQSKRLAHAMMAWLPKIEKFGSKYDLKAYVHYVRSLFVVADNYEKLIKNCEIQIKSQKNVLQQYSGFVQGMEIVISTFRDEIRRLRSLKPDLKEIENCEQYKRENNISNKSDFSEPKTKKESFIPFPFIQNLKWNEVIMTIHSNEDVNIEARNIQKKCHYVEMGFKDERKGDSSTMSWELLKQISKCKGEINFNTHLGHKKNLDKDISRLRKKLKSFMSIKDNPIPYLRGKYDKKKKQ